MKLRNAFLKLAFAVLLYLPTIVNGQMLDFGAVPAITKPQSDQSSANQKLDFHTDLFTGRFNYRVPIEVPPGRGGSEPSIAIQYNSSGGNGWCGVGWDLDLGYIQRETRRGVPMTAAAYDGSYGYTYSIGGQSGRLILASDGTYRPEISTSFLKFIQSGGSWVVYDKSGRVYVFGADAASQVSAPSGASGTFKWYLSTVQDANGNQTKVFYQLASTSKQLFPYQVVYNANANNSSLQNNCIIQFGVSTSRSDIPNSCLSGQELSVPVLLQDIWVYCNSKQVRHYTLNYTSSPSSGRSLLQSVQEHGTNDNWVYPATTFNYSALANSFQPVQRWPITSQAPGPGSLLYTSPSSQNTQLIDMNGDGLPDWVSSQYNTPYTYYVVQTNTGTGFGPPQSWAVANEQNDTGIFWNSVNNSFMPVPNGGRAAYCKLVDINGDGLPDRVMCPYGTSGYFQVQTNTGHGFGPVQHWNGVSSIDTQTSPDWAGPGYSLYDYGSDSQAIMIDMNGDGLADLLMLGSISGQFQVGINSGVSSSSFNANLPWTGVGDNNGIRRQYQIEGVVSDLIDMNGDGLPDRVVPGNVQLNLGAWGTSAGSWGHFDSKLTWYMPANAPFSVVDWQTTSYYRQLIDINGDGLPDLVVVTNDDKYTSFSTNANYLVYYNTGAGFSSTPVVWSGVNSSAGPSYGLQAWDSSSTKVIFMDINGDGLPDRIIRNNMGGSDCLLVQLNSGPFPDLLTSVNNNIGGTVTVSYTNSTTVDNSDGTRSRMPFPVQIVSSVHSDGGMGSGVTTSYTYHYGLYDTTCREFRGFGIVDATDLYGTKTTTYFHQGGGRDFSSHGEYQDSRYKAGMPYDVITYGSDGILYKETINQIGQVQVDANGVYFPYVASVFDFSAEPNSASRATLKTYTYDVKTNNISASTGNLLSISDLGEVGAVTYSYTYTDIPDPVAYTTFTYATLSNPYIIDKPQFITVSSDVAGNNILRQTWYQYFGSTGNLMEKSDRICPSTFANTFYTYDVCGNVKTITDPMGLVTTINYDSSTVTFPVQRYSGTLTNGFQYDPQTGNLLFATNEQGIVTGNNYDGLLRLTNTAISTSPNSAPTLTRKKIIYWLAGISSGTSQNYVEELFNDPASVGGYHVTFSYFDGLGRTVQIRDQTETANQYRVVGIYYDGRGQVALNTYPTFSTGVGYTLLNGNFNCTWTMYDPIGRKATYYPQASAPFSGGIWTAWPTPMSGDGGSPVGPTYISHNDSANPWAFVTVNGLGKVQKYLLDAHGRTNQVVEYLGSNSYTTTLFYNQVGDLTNITDSGNNSISLFYDGAGRRIAMIDPDMGFVQYNYDLDGRIKNQIDAKGQQLRYYYADPNGRLTRREGWNSSGACVSTNIWLYDTSTNDSGYTVYPGQVYQIIDDEGWQKYSYDARNRTTVDARFLSKNGQIYKNLYYYDDADRLVSTTYPNNGPTITNIYDSGQHLYQVKSSTGTNYYTGGGYNEFNQIGTINYGNGALSAFKYYANSKRLCQISTSDSTSATIQNTTNRYDAIGNILGVQDLVSSHLNQSSGSITNAVYDDLNRLVAASWSGYGTKNYGYNTVGNVLTNGESGVTNYVYGTIRPHAVRSANGMWYTYDLNGNIVFRGRQRLDYDVNNHLYRVINTNGTVTTFGYAGTGDRLWEKSGTNALQIWIGNNYEEKNSYILYHITANGKTICTFDKSGTNVFEYYHPDYLTSTTLQTDKGGLQIQHYEYTAFGQTRFTQSTNVFRVSRLYTGQVIDDSTGLYYYNARYYDPILARFSQPDDIIPDIFNPQSYNRYSYCVNNPLRYTDPSGHGPIDDALFNTGTFKSSYRLMTMPDSTGWKIVEVPVAVAGMAVAGADVVFNFSSLGGKAAVEGGVKEVVKTGIELGEKTFAHAGSDASKSIIGNVAKTTELEERAKQIHQVLDSRAQRARTTAVTETEEGIRVVSSSEKRLSPAQRRALKTDEIEGVGLGHAETTGIAAAKAAGLNPTLTAASRPICGACAKSLEEQGVQAASKFKTIE